MADARAVFCHAPACLPTEALKLLTLSFLQSISNFVVSFLNVSEENAKGLLFRQRRGFTLSELAKHFKLCRQLTEPK